MRRRDVIAAFGALATTPAFAQDAKPLTVRYASAPRVEANLQSLDVYGAAPGRKRPIMAFIHGGSWAYGDKANIWNGRDKAAAFTPHFVFASLNYRLSPAVRHPAHVQDVAAAIAWLHDNAASIGGDPDRIYVMGHSAGAHLAALVATDERRLAAHNLPLTTIKGVIALDGDGYDLIAAAPKTKALLISSPYRNAFGTGLEGWADASPTMHVASRKGIAPFLLVYTARGGAVTQSKALAEKLRKAGVSAALLSTPDQTHSDVNRQFGKSGDMVTAKVIDALTKWGA